MRRNQLLPTFHSFREHTRYICTQKEDDRGQPLHTVAMDRPNKASELLETLVSKSGVSSQFLRTTILLYNHTDRTHGAVIPPHGRWTLIHAVSRNRGWLHV